MIEKKHIHIITHGCQMNLYDSVRMKESLATKYDSVDRPDLADLIIINTCSVREKPQQKVLRELANFEHLKRKNPRLILAVAGCVAQQEKDKLLKQVPYLDLVIGPDKVDELPNLLANIDELNKSRLKQSKLQQSAIGFNKEAFHLDEYPILESFGTGGNISAYIAVQKGCNKFCSYCIVPHTRGREKSRPLLEIVREVEKYALAGVVEITLLGQNINAYGEDLAGVDFADMMNAVCEVNGIRRIRFVTSHPASMTDRHIEVIAAQEKICDYLHLPIQSGSDKVLKEMNRGYTVKEYIDIIEKFKKHIPMLAVTGDMIIGFPNESEDDFKQTLRLMDIIRYDTQFSFIYSKRPGTKAAFIDDKVSIKEKKERLNRLQDLQKQHTLDSNVRLVGNIEEVLVEHISKKSADDLSGRTRGNKIVNFKADSSLLGSFVPVKIVQAYKNSLRGVLEK